ncbi:STAS domain-containing protein [Actinokineospora auranticolor]|uniref:Anti-anti-sigma factor n=1 Tax=Actinokineospora auranticolor TaxID=155976 RepID=A0A2S6GJA1_9PSEU|nr:STAS domain-containing protein [Actinokineospora auranticolor]PPK65295.1 anti-anti-sigma factor [Actinokineospora auranticolor]
MAPSFARPTTPHPRRELNLSVHRGTHAVTITASGHIDLATEAPWHDHLMRACTAADDTTRVTADLTAVTFLSWASAAVLLRAHRACHRRGRAFRVLATGPVLTGLQLTRLHEEITIIPTTRPVTRAPAPAASGWLIA